MQKDVKTHVKKTLTCRNVNKDMKGMVGMKKMEIMEKMKESKIEDYDNMRY